LVELVDENSRAQLKVTEADCAYFENIYDALYRVDAKCLEFISSKRIKEILRKFLERSKKSKQSGLVYPELPTVPSALRERVPKSHDAAITAAELTKLVQDRDQEKRELEVKLAVALAKKKWSGLRQDGKKLGRPYITRGRIGSEE